MKIGVKRLFANATCFLHMDSEMPPETPQERHPGKLDPNMLGNNLVDLTHHLLVCMMT